MSEIEEVATAPEDLEKTLARVRQSNQDKYTAIARDGARIDPASIMALRFETFLDTFLTDDDRISFELNFESRFQEQLNAALAQIRQAKLTSGTNAQSLFVPGK